MTPTEQELLAAIQANPEQFNLESAPFTEPNTQSPPQQEEPVEIPPQAASFMADSMLGMVNNFMQMGAGFVVQVKKPAEFYDYQEMVDLIDGQNTKNIERLQLDQNDKAMLKPILMSMMPKFAKALTPEQQLTMAAVTILLKKAQIAMEIRAENKILLERCTQIIREKKAAEQAVPAPPVQVTQEEKQVQTPTPFQTSEPEPTPEPESTEESTYQRAFPLVPQAQAEEQDYLWEAEEAPKATDTQPAPLEEAIPSQHPAPALPTEETNVRIQAEFPQPTHANPKSHQGESSESFPDGPDQSVTAPAPAEAKPAPTSQKQSFQPEEDIGEPVPGISLPQAATPLNAQAPALEPYQESPPKAPKRKRIARKPIRPRQETPPARTTTPIE